MGNVKIQMGNNINFYLNFSLQGLAMPVVMGFGLVGNILSILVLRSPGIDMKVGTLAECDNFLMVFDSVSNKFGFIISIGFGIVKTFFQSSSSAHLGLT